MASKPVKVLVVVPERRFPKDDGSEGTYPGIWAGGRFWPNGKTEAVLEDIEQEPLIVHDFVTGEATEKKRVITVEQQLRQIKFMEGGETRHDHEGKPFKTPGLLAFSNLGEVAPGELQRMKAAAGATK